MTTSAQYESLTNSTNGSNVQAKQVCSSHFFLEGAGYSQSSGQSFGPQSNQEFRTTAEISISTPAKIYSICSGVIFLQPQTGTTNKVNLILKPFKQPIPGLAIKYFIYRGLSKSNFVDTNTNEIAPELTTKFTEHIWGEFNDFYQTDTDPNPTFFAKYIGFPENITNQPGADLIEKYFNKITPIIDPNQNTEDPNSAYEYPIIPKGLQLSTETGNIGFDIVLDQGDYFENDNTPFKLDLNFARASAGVIDTSSETDSFRIKIMKEASQWFLDPAAFYGMHANGAGKLTVDDSQATFLDLKTEVYTRLNGFHSKNRLYVYIQSDFQRSYDFYGGYQNDQNKNFQIAQDENGLIESEYGSQGWPIQIFESSQNAATEINEAVLKLNSDLSKESLLYIKTGFTESVNKDGFLKRYNLFPENIIPDGELHYSKPISISFPSIGADTISTFIYLIYHGKKSTALEHIVPSGTGNDPIPKHLEIKGIDSLFNMINGNSFILPQSNNQFPRLSNKVFRLLNISKGIGNGFSIAVSTNKLKDSISTVDELTFVDRLTYETILERKENTSANFMRSETVLIENQTSGLNEWNDGYYKPSPPYEMRKVMFHDATGTTTTGIVLEKSKSHPTKIILGITDDENQLFIGLSTLENLTNTRFFFDDLSLTGEEVFLDSDGIKFKKYSLRISGENALGELKIFDPPQPVTIYSLDQNVFFSAEYSKYIPESLVLDEGSESMNYGFKI